MVINLFKKKSSYRARSFLGAHPEVNRWVVSDFIIDKLIPLVGTRPFPLSEIELLVSAVLWYRPTHICDWGTHIGKATRIFYETVTAFNLKSRVISVDLPEEVSHVEHPHGERGRLVRHIPGVTLLLGDGVSTSLSYLRRFKKNHLRPLFFLDGDHAKSSVERELRYIYKSYPKAIIIVHDTFYQTKESTYNIGPFEAVKEFLAEHKKYTVYSTSFGLPGMTVIIPENYE